MPNTAFCFLLSAYCLLPTAFCRLLFLLIENAQKIIRFRRRHLRQLQIFLDMTDAAHPHKRGGNSRRRAHKLNTGLRVGGK